jgi:hypothetical protein
MYECQEYIATIYEATIYEAVLPEYEVYLCLDL